MHDNGPGKLGAVTWSAACLVVFGVTLGSLALTEQFSELPGAIVACAAGWFILRGSLDRLEQERPGPHRTGSSPS